MPCSCNKKIIRLFYAYTIEFLLTLHRQYSLNRVVISFRYGEWLRPFGKHPRSQKRQYLRIKVVHWTRPLCYFSVRFFFFLAVLHVCAEDYKNGLSL